ncbi:MAG: hypothetical protein RL095_1925 [Verrucomicrobiota bacterium]|jgi:prepilin-type processing-associated H-X9-DG protein
MSAENPQDRSPSWTTILLVLVLGAVLAAMILPAFRPHPSQVNHSIAKCKNRLKQIGLTIQSYYSDGATLNLPVFSDPRVFAECGGLGLDANLLTCPAARLGPTPHYHWNPKASGSPWADWANNPYSLLIWDASPHKSNGKIIVLFGDGHVEELTPSELVERRKR